MGRARRDQARLRAPETAPNCRPTAAPRAGLSSSSILLIEHLAAGVQPGDPLAVAGRQHDAVNLGAARAGARRSPRCSASTPSPRQRRDRERRPRAARLRRARPSRSSPSSRSSLFHASIRGGDPASSRPERRQARASTSSRLRVAVGMRDVADVDDEVGRGDFLQRRPERRDQLGRQVGDEADRVGQDRLVEPGQLECRAWSGRASRTADPRRTRRRRSGG